MVLVATCFIPVVFVPSVMQTYCRTALYRISIIQCFSFVLIFADTGALLLTGPSSQVLLVLFMHEVLFMHATHSKFQKS